MNPYCSALCNTLLLCSKELFDPNMNKLALRYSESTMGLWCGTPTSRRCPSFMTCLSRCIGTRQAARLIPWKWLWTRITTGLSTSSTTLHLLTMLRTSASAKWTRSVNICWYVVVIRCRWYCCHCSPHSAPCGAGAPLFPPCPSFPLLLFPFFYWLYLFSSFVHPFPFYQNSPTPFPGRRS